MISPQLQDSQDSYSKMTLGSPTITCKGTRLSPQAKQALSKARKGQEISIFDLKVQNPEKPNYRFKRVAPVLIEIL